MPEPVMLLNRAKSFKIINEGKDATECDDDDDEANEKKPNWDVTLDMSDGGSEGGEEGTLGGDVIADSPLVEVAAVIVTPSEVRVEVTTEPAADI